MKLTLKKINTTDNSPKSVTASPTFSSSASSPVSSVDITTPKISKPIVSPIVVSATTFTESPVQTPKSDSSSDDSDSKKRMIREALSKRVKDDLLRQSQPILEQPKATQQQSQALPVQNNDHLRSLLNNVVRNLKKTVDEEDFHFSETK